MMIVLVRMSSLVYPVAPVHLTWGMLNVWQSASVAKISTITSFIVNRQRDDITLNSEATLLLTRAGRIFYINIHLTKNSAYIKRVCPLTSFSWASKLTKSSN